MSVSVVTVATIFGKHINLLVLWTWQVDLGYEKQDGLKPPGTQTALCVTLNFDFLQLMQGLGQEENEAE